MLGASDVRAANVIFAWSRFGKRQLDVIIEGCAACSRSILIP